MKKLLTLLGLLVFTLAACTTATPEPTAEPTEAPAVEPTDGAL